MSALTDALRVVRLISERGPRVVFVTAGGDVRSLNPAEFPEKSSRTVIGVYDHRASADDIAEDIAYTLGSAT